jgi:hypothetical protein
MIIIKDLVIEITSRILEEFLHNTVIIIRYINLKKIFTKINFDRKIKTKELKSKSKPKESFTEVSLNKLILFSKENPWKIANKIKNTHRFSRFVLKEEDHVNRVEIVSHAIQF